MFKNLHVFWHPLRAEDKIVYFQSKNQRFSTSSNAEQKQKRAQEKFRAKRARRLNAANFGSITEKESDYSALDDSQNRL